MNAKEKMLAGLPFDTHDADLGREREKATRLLQKFNTLTLFDGAYREILRELLPNTTTECLIRPPFFCDYGYNIYIGEGGFINFNCVMLDGAPIRIGNNVLIGPAVQIYTFHHPIDHLERREVEICRPVTIGDDCWIGPGAVIHDGARIGRRCRIHTAASVACLPQDLKFAGEITTCEIGDDNDIREYVTISRGTASTGTTRIGSKNLLMAYVHIGHDCIICG